MKIDGLEYLVTEEDFKYLQNRGSSFAYALQDNEDFYNRKFLRVYNHNTKEHYYVESVYPKVGDSNLLFIDFPRSNAPVDSWMSGTTRHANITSWNKSEKDLGNDFVRFTIEYIDKEGYCQLFDGRKKCGGWYSRSCFYKINKVFKM